MRRRFTAPPFKLSQSPNQRNCQISTRIHPTVFIWSISPQLRLTIGLVNWIESEYFSAGIKQQGVVLSRPHSSLRLCALARSQMISLR